MSRRFCLILAAWASLALGSAAKGQTPPTETSNPTPASPAPASGDDVAQLQTENTMLKKEVSDASNTIKVLQAQLAKHHITPDATPSTDVPAPGTATPDAGAPVPGLTPAGPMKALPLDDTNAASGTAPAADSGPSRSYTVVKGDSLWKIAHKMYPGDTKNGVEKLQDANKDSIGNKPLKIGQVLVVPQ